MNSFPPDLRFRHPWRPYQQRVLDEVEQHLDDRHFHIAAAPGAGKTVLGLEVLRRLQRPALVLVPSTAIQAQWVQRLVESFLPAGARPAWVSTRLDEPRLITVCTYQAVHAATRKAGTAALHATLAAAGITTLVLDEAHHLRQQWWRALIKLKASLGEPWLIALTGTPPYDVPQLEWNRYIELCGPIDAEISTPELVKAGTLCPHQDYLHLSRPTPDEQAALQRFDNAVSQLLTELMLEPALLDVLRRHPVVVDPESRLDAMSRRSDYLFAIAVFLQSTAPEANRALLHALDLAELTLPTFDRAWCEVLLNGLLFDGDDAIAAETPPLPALLHRLRRLGAVWQKRVHLQASPKLLRALERSSSKLHGVREIIEAEAAAARIGLRALVLCDQLRLEAFPAPGDAPATITAIGVAPVFEMLRPLRLPDVRLALLSGSVVVVPRDTADELRRLARQAGVTGASLDGIALWHDPTYQRFDLAPGDAGAFVAAATALFERGDLNTLVGSTALLGEGWDAPSLATLVLVSSVRSSMLSNQMRGRALRIQPGNPDKTANIWHLACLPAASATTEPDAARSAVDVRALSQRFRTFAGICVRRAVIENGIARLGVDIDRLPHDDVGALNARSHRDADDRHGVRNAWSKALQLPAGSPQRLVIEVRTSMRRFTLGTPLRHATRWAVQPWLRWLHDWLVRRHLQRLADALLAALRDIGLVHSAGAEARVAIREGAASCRLHGATSQEESRYAECLRELFDLPDNPRYLLRHREVSYSVPACFGQNRERVDCLRARVEARLGRCELLFLRNAAGRRALLKAKERWLAERFEIASDSRMFWG